MNTDHYAISPETIPWVPLRPGLSMRPLHFEADGYSLHLRLEPGTVIGRHRHSGQVSAINLSGFREIVDTGEIIGPGEFIFEPDGNEDHWRCHGEVPCVVHITLTGRIDYLGDDGESIDHSDSETARAAYLEHCAAVGIEPDPRILGPFAVAL